MQMSLRFLWPRAESNVYLEPKRLVAARLAVAHHEANGERRRTIYSITSAGRSALARWLASPSSTQRYESEAAIKVFFAENGTKADLLESIRALKMEAAATIEHFLQFAKQYEAGQGQYPQRFALSGLIARLACEQQVATLRWAVWAEQEVEQWRSSRGPDAKWGVDALKATGKPFGLQKDPVLPLVEGAQKQRLASRPRTRAR